MKTPLRVCPGGAAALLAASVLLSSLAANEIDGGRVAVSVSPLAGEETRQAAPPIAALTASRAGSPSLAAEEQRPRIGLIEPQASGSNRDGIPVDLYGDPLPRGAIARLGTIRYRHEGWRKRVFFLSDNETLVVGAPDNTVRFWNARSGRMTRELDLGSARLQAFGLSRDRRSIAVLASDFDSQRREYRVRLTAWDIGSGRPRSETNWVEPMAEQSQQLAFDPGGKIVAVGTRSGNLRIWDLQAGQELLSYAIMKGEIQSVAFSPDGKCLAATGRSGVALWEWLSSTPPTMIEGLPEGAQVATFSPDGSLLAIGSRECAARLWDVKSRRFARKLTGNADWYYHQGLVFSSDGRRLVVPSYNANKIELFDVDSGMLERSLDTEAIRPGDLALSADGKVLAMVGSEAAIAVWDLESGKRLDERFIGHAESPYEIDFAPDGGAVVTGCLDGTIRLWDARDGRQLRTLQHARWVCGLAVSPDGKSIASCGLDDTVRLWDFASGRQVYQLCGHGTSGGSGSWEIGFASDSRRFLSFGADLFLRVWDTRTGKALLEHPIRPSGVKFRESENGNVELAERDPFSPGGFGLSLMNARFASDGQRLLLGFRGAIHAVDTQSGREIEVIRPDDYLDDFIVSLDAKLLATLERSLPRPGQQPSGPSQPAAFLRLRDFASKKLIRQIALPGRYGHDVAFGRDAQLIGVSLYNESAPRKLKHSIRVWDTNHGDEYARIEELTGQTHQLAFSPDAKRLASSLSDSTVVIWDLDLFRLQSPKGTKPGATP